jgi:hypothetical protein
MSHILCSVIGSTLLFVGWISGITSLGTLTGIRRILFVGLSMLVTVGGGLIMFIHGVSL